MLLYYVSHGFDAPACKGGRGECPDPAMVIRHHVQQVPCQSRWQLQTGTVLGSIRANIDDPWVCQQAGNIVVMGNDPHGVAVGVRSGERTTRFAQPFV